jgi:ribosomal RNA-processing protein 8
MWHVLNVLHLYLCIIILHYRGLLKIAEVESRFEDVQTFIQKLQKFGFINTWKDLSHLFYFMDFKKERCISKKMKKKLPDLTLKPCLYKKR